MIIMQIWYNQIKASTKLKESFKILQKTDKLLIQQEKLKVGWKSYITLKNPRKEVLIEEEILGDGWKKTGEIMDHKNKI